VPCVGLKYATLLLATLEAEEKFCDATASSGTISGWTTWTSKYLFSFYPLVLGNALVYNLYISI